MLIAHHMRIPQNPCEVCHQIGCQSHTQGGFQQHKCFMPFRDQCGYKYLLNSASIGYAPAHSPARSPAACKCSLRRPLLHRVRASTLASTLASYMQVLTTAPLLPQVRASTLANTLIAIDGHRLPWIANRLPIDCQYIALPWIASFIRYANKFKSLLLCGSVVLYIREGMRHKVRDGR